MSQQLPSSISPATTLMGVMFNATLADGQASAVTNISLEQAASVAAALAPLLPNTQFGAVAEAIAKLVKESPRFPVNESDQRTFNLTMQLLQYKKNEKIEAVERAKLANSELEADIEIENQRLKGVELKARLQELRQPHQSSPYARQPTAGRPTKQENQ